MKKQNQMEIQVLKAIATRMAECSDKYAIYRMTSMKHAHTLAHWCGCSHRFIYVQSHTVNMPNYKSDIAQVSLYPPLTL